MKTSRVAVVAALFAVLLFSTQTARADRHWGRGGYYRGYGRGPGLRVGVGYGYGYGYWPYYYGPYYSPYYAPAYYYDGPGRPVYTGRVVDTGGGSAHSLAADVQRTLARQEYYLGAIDGDIGPASREAIREYQRDHGLHVTGRIDDRLLRSMDL